MTNNAAELLDAVTRLSPQELAVFRALYTDFDAKQWDQQFENDVATGRLDWLLHEARKDRQEGRCEER